jgi:hypothetical protein
MDICLKNECFWQILPNGTGLDSDRTIQIIGGRQLQTQHQDLSSVRCI